MKRWASLAAMLILLLVVLVGTAGQTEAAEILYSGSCGEGITWTLDTRGVLSVSGAGAMQFASFAEAPWKPHANQIRKIVIGDGVTSIPSYAFYNSIHLTDVEISGSVSVVGDNAFWYCGALNSVTLGEGVQKLGKEAFAYCESLRSITLPSSVAQLGDSLFLQCSSLEEVTFLGDAPVFGSNVFRWAYEVTAYYPRGNETWTPEVRLNYGGYVNWVASCVGGHNWSGWSILEAPTCIWEGVEYRFCVDCFRGDEREMPVVAHQWSDWSNVDGGQSRVCDVCGNMEYIFDAPFAGYNRDHNFYPKLNFVGGSGRMYYTTIQSHLIAENGGYTRVEHLNGMLVVETYDSELNFLTCRGISLELPVYGGVYLGEDYNFVVSGQMNTEEDNYKEVIRVTKYTKEWVRVDAASLYGGYTTEPFSSGTLRFARSGDMLYVRTCHKMYTNPSDGLNHQANVNLSVYIPTMEITDGNYTVSYHSAGYVSHSFNQFVLVDGEDYIAVDHGDAYPRAVVMFRVRGGAGVPMFPYSNEEINVLPIGEATGIYQFTGASVGGLAASSTHYLVVGSSVDQVGGEDQRIGQHNVFVTVTPKNEFFESATQMIWLTDYDSGADVELSPPHMIQLETDRFLLIWTENDSLRHCYINGKGELDGEIYENQGSLSDCVPFLDGNRVLWYVTGYEEEYWPGYWREVETLPVFYQIDLDAPEKVSRANCSHEYETVVTEPTCTEPGYTTHSCIHCGHSYTDAPTEPLGHRWGEWEIVTAPTLENTGEKCRVCTACGLEERETIPALEFLYGDVNADGTVNGKDLILLRQKLANWDVTLNEAAADCNGDCVVNGKDLILLRQLLANWDVTLGPQ